MFSFFFSSRRRHTRSLCDWSSDVCSSDLRSELGERQGKGPLHQAADAEAPALVGRRDIEVDQQVVQSGWRDVVAQCLERHAMIARSQLDFLRRMVPNDGRAAGGPRTQSIL